FRVLEMRNSPLTAEGLAGSGAEPGEPPGWLRGLLAAGARVVATLSRRRWLLAPSIELYACRAGGDARPCSASSTGSPASPAGAPRRHPSQPPSPPRPRAP